MVDRTSGGYNTVLCNQVFLPRLQSSRENTVDNSGPNYRPITILIATGLMLSISMGIRQVFGLFVQPMVKDLGLTLSDLTLAISIQNLAWGILQPFSGALVGRFGFRPILLAGAALYVAGLGILSAANGTASVMLGAGVLVGASLACTGSAISQAVASRATSGPRRSIVLGLIVGVGSLGALAAAPLGQSVTNVYGWRAGVLAVLALASLLFPAAWVAGRVDRIPLPDTASRNRADKSALAAMRLALHRPAFLVMTTAYFVCGMQLLFIATHLPSYLALCGMDPMLAPEALSCVALFNVAGSLFFGWAGSRWSKLVLLGSIYVVRSLVIAWYFAAFPTPASTLIFASAMGFLWLGVGPLVSGAVAEMFGLRWQAMIQGIAFMSHQLGSFAGAFGGGLVFDIWGRYDLAWHVGVGLGLTAGSVQIATALIRRNPGAPTKLIPAFPAHCRE